VAREDLPAWLAGFNAALGGGRTDEWVMLLRAGDTLPAHALYWFACEAQARADAAIVYSDDDIVDAEGRRCEPRFKPGWSPTHLRSTHYVGAAAILRGSAVAAAGGVSPDCCRHGNYDLLLRVIDSAGGKVAHVPAVLLHRAGGARAGSAWEDPRWCARSLEAHLARNGVAAEVVQTFPGCRRVRHHLPAAPPLVSIIVPTRDQATLLRQCVESVLEKTTYPRFEILVVDNRSADPEALACLAKLAGHPAVRVLRHDRPFNYSTINNFAARLAGGEVLCLLNNDTEVISPDWLEEMVGHLMQEGVGAVGAKLYYPDGHVQHAGVAVGPGGCANHLHVHLARGEPGYCSRAVVAHEGSAVTAACLATWKRLYQRLGGLNEEMLTVAFNDVDYCLRLQEAGYRVIFTPHAELYHHESATRGTDEPLRKRLRARREVKYMRTRWRGRMQRDPYYNPNLSYRRPDFSLSETPRVRKPWLR
jgi:GT2 family glycosyltransferase